jgi:hypothetical protein
VDARLPLLLGYSAAPDPSLERHLFSIKSKEDCHLTLVNVDAKGEGTVIFPNKFQQDNFLPAGKEAQFPGSTAPFQFRLKDPGTETVIAICNATGKEADGIKHDFKKRQFTELGRSPKARRAKRKRRKRRSLPAAPPRARRPPTSCHARRSSSWSNRSLMDFRNNAVL